MAFPDAASALQIAVGAAVLAVLVGLGGWLLVRRRRDVWLELARRRGLTFVESPEGPQVTGTVRDRPVKIGLEPRGSDTGIAVAVVQISVGLQGVPRRMSAEDTRGLIGDLATMGQDRIEIGSPAFDRDVLLKSNDPTRTRDYWHTQRQRAFLEVLHSGACDQVAIKDGTLTAERRITMSDRRRLEQLLDLLLDAAERLDAGSPEPRE